MPRPKKLRKDLVADQKKHAKRLRPGKKSDQTIMLGLKISLEMRDVLTVVAEQKHKGNLSDATRECIEHGVQYLAEHNLVEGLAFEEA